MSRGEEVGGPGVGRYDMSRTDTSCDVRASTDPAMAQTSSAAELAQMRDTSVAWTVAAESAVPRPSRLVPTLESMAVPTITEAVVLRSFAFGEADRVLHVYSLASGRIGAVAKGVRRTKSRFGGRLEPFSHVELSIHRGRGELGTVTGASLVRSHDAIRIDPYRLQVGLVGLEAMLRLYTDEERNDRAFLALTRFLDALDSQAPQPGGGLPSIRSSSRSS